MSADSTKEMVVAAWKEWPLEEYREFDPNDLPFNLLLSDDLPPVAIKAIDEIAVTGCGVYLSWKSDSFVIVEHIEPIIDSDEKEDMVTNGVDWRSRLHQSFDVLVSYEFYNPESGEVKKWLDDLNEVATEAAARDFKLLQDIHLYVLDDSRSAIPSVAVLFSVGGIARTDADNNRAQVKKWAEQVFASLLSSATANTDLIAAGN